jgi:hypothetical protein
MVPRFEGNEEDNFQEWVDKLEDVFRLRETPNGSKVPMAKLFMGGPAYRWLCNLERIAQDDARITTWAQLKTAIQQHFVLSQSGFTLRSRLNAMRWTPGAMLSLNQYGDRFRQLALRINDCSEPEIIYCFAKSLPPAMQSQVVLNNPATFDMALYYAKQYAESYRQDFVVPPAAPSHANGPQPMELDYMGRPGYSNNRRCYACDGLGHIARVCPNNNNNRGSGKRGRRGNRPRGGPRQQQMNAMEAGYDEDQDDYAHNYAIGYAMAKMRGAAPAGDDNQPGNASHQ